MAMIGTAAAAQPYGYNSGYGDRYHGRDSDRDGISDAREWNRDRDRDGRADQYDRYDNRRHQHRRGRSHYIQPSYGYYAQPTYGYYAQSTYGYYAQPTYGYYAQPSYGYYDHGYGNGGSVIFSFRSR